MAKKSWYIENSLALTKAIDKIKADFPCFVDRQLIEMDMSYVQIEAREEDIQAIEDILAPLM